MQPVWSVISANSSASKPLQQCINNKQKQACSTRAIETAPISKG